MKHLSKRYGLLKTKVLPVLMVVMMVVTTVSVAFSVSGFSAFAAGEDRVPVGTGAQSQAKDAFWVNATYFDYLSDAEMTNGWLKPIQGGTGYNGADDNWYSFYNFNTFVSNNAGAWATPLYLGNFCNNHDAYPYDIDNTGHVTDQTKHGGPYDTAKNGLTNYSYLVNNSNSLKDYHTSLKGIVSNKLSDGTIQSSDDKKMIYFDKDKLGDKAKVFDSYFPFRSAQNGKVTQYSFDSQDAKDNVYFDWNGTTPKAVNYGQGTTYGVEDGLKYFMNPDEVYDETGKPYKDGTYYGIYPFNNSAATKGARGGNDNLDHGFGIKMDMDFKVPKDGLLEDGSPVKFTYTGDDDLWVFISKRDGSESQLVLDLGGNHKKASGSIDFSTMTATANKTAHVNDKNDSKSLYIYDKFGWGSNMKVHAWGNGAGEWYDVTKCDGFPVAKGEGGANVDVYSVSSDTKGSGGTKLGDMKYFSVTKAMDDWSETPKYNGSEATEIENTAANTESHNGDAKAGIISERLNKMTYSDNPGYNMGGTVTPQVDGASETTSFGFVPTMGTYQTLDPNEVYHMTIFYMERGEIESNCSMAFTMTPAANELEVTNKVGIEGLNSSPEFKTDVDKKIKNEVFHYDVTDGNKPLDADLKDGERTEDKFDNKYLIGSKINVKETYTSNFTYKTDWKVVDVADNENVVKKSPDGTDSKDTDNFDFKNKNPEMDFASMRVDYVNMAKCAPLDIDKKIVTAAGDPSSDTDEFTFTMKVDINGGTDYKAYPLTYKVGSTESTMSNDGSFSFKSSDKVTVEGLPVGSTYQITETDKTGYTAEKKVVTGKIESSENKASFTNKQDPTEPPTTEAPTTEPPTTEPPTTEPPTTLPDAEGEGEFIETTAPPTTEPPTTEPPTTEPPTTEPPTTTAPPTAPPTTLPVTEPATEKEPTPEISKKIVNSKLTDTYTTAALNETVTFGLTAKRCGTSTRKLNGFTIVDTMSEGLTFDKIKSVTLDGKKTLTKDDYKLKMTDEGFEVSITDAQLKTNEFYTYTNVIVTYTAKLNKDSVIGAEGNPNSDALKWVDADNASHDKDGNEVIVYTFQIDVNKVDSKTDEPLEGATFGVYKTEDDAKDGKNAIAEVKSDDEGLASFERLDAGTYYVKETKTIKGYNLNTKVYTVKVQPKFENGELADSDDGIVSVTIENTAAALPKTGFAPTIAFTLAGSLLIGGAVLLFLIALRRKAYSKLNH